MCSDKFSVFDLMSFIGYPCCVHDSKVTDCRVLIHVSGLKKGGVRLSRSTRLFCWAGNFTFSLAKWAEAQASHLLIKS